MPLPLKEWSGDVMVSICVVQLLVDSGMEANKLVEVLRRGTVDPISSTIPNISQWDEPGGEFNKNKDISLFIKNHIALDDDLLFEWIKQSIGF